MKQFTEDYVSCEIAVLLKEKGFNEEYCYKYYDKNKELEHCEKIINNAVIDDGFPSEALSVAPTHQMALKWLREVHKIFVEPFVSIDLNGKYHYCFRLLNSICKDILEPKDLVRIDFKDTYEEAVEAALKYTLENLI